MSGSEVRLGMEARKKVRRIIKAEDAIAEATATLDELRRELDEQVAKESARFGLEVPHDALVLDVLELVEVGPDEEWTWLGGSNNHGTPYVRYREGAQMHDRTVTRLLAEAFGLVESSWEGILYPEGSAQDVNPFHRTLREFPDGRQRGNARRYWRDDATEQATA